MERENGRGSGKEMKINAKILLQIAYIEGRPNVSNRANSCRASAYAWGWKPSKVSRLSSRFGATEREMLYARAKWQPCRCTFAIPGAIFIYFSHNFFGSVSSSTRTFYLLIFLTFLFVLSPLQHLRLSRFLHHGWYILHSIAHHSVSN